MLNWPNGLILCLLRNEKKFVCDGDLKKLIIFY